MKEVEQMFDYLSDLGWTHTFRRYEYDAAKKDMIKRLNLQPENSSHAQNDGREVSKSRNGCSVTRSSDADLFRILASHPDCSAGPFRPGTFAVGKALLLDDGRAFFELTPICWRKWSVEKYGVVTAWRAIRVARIPGALRVRTTASLGLQAKTRYWKTSSLISDPTEPTGAVVKPLLNGVTAETVTNW